jgi:ubiquinone/menaquinone biosynthesis C-methylase UbiE
VISAIIHSIVAQPLVYDMVQWLAGIDHTRRRLQPHLAQTAGQAVLDVGAGTGLYLSSFPPTAKYHWLDNDPQKLQGFQARSSKTFPAVLGDGTQIGLRDKSIDYVTCIGVAHHLTDAQLARLVSEMARVAQKKLIFLEPLDTDAWQSALMWRYDRGSYPRTAQALKLTIERCFAIEYSETYAIYHQYLLLIAKPT